MKLFLNWITARKFLDDFSKIIHELAPINKNLINKRSAIQKQIDTWHKSNRGKELDKKEYIIFEVNWISI